MKKGIIFFLVFKVFCLWAFTSLAQGNRNVNQTIYSNNYSTSISPFLFLSSSSALTLPSFTNLSDLETGLESSAINVVVEANVNWKLTTEIGVITFVKNSDSPVDVKSPLTYVNFSIASTTTNDLTYSTFSPFGINFQSSTKTGILGNKDTAGNTFNMKLKVTPGFEVDPANYTVPIIMTVSGR